MTKVDNNRFSVRYIGSVQERHLRGAGGRRPPKGKEKRKKKEKSKKKEKKEEKKRKKEGNYE